MGMESADKQAKKQLVQQLLHLLEDNSRYDIPTLAGLLATSEEEVDALIKELEDKKVILKYTATIAWDKTDHVPVTAMIDVKVTPKKGVGFDEIARRIYRYPEVEAVYLMSGAYDLSVIVKGKTMHEIAEFVAKKLSPLDSVISTTTHFILKKYKHDGVIFDDGSDDRRMVITP